MLDGNKHLPVVKPRRLPQHISYLVERLALKNRELSGANRRLTSFYCVSRLPYQSDKARGTQCCKWNQCLQSQTKMSKLYVSPPRKVFPVKAAHTPPFRFHGMAGNRLLPHTVCKGGKTRHGRWDFTKHIIQINVEKSNKMSDLCRWKADVCLDNFRSLGYNRNTRRCLPETSTSPWRNPDGCHNIQVTSLSA